MATMVADPVFVDTNVLVYSRIAHSPLQGNASAKLGSIAAAGHPLWVSRQVLREFLASMSRPGTLNVPTPMATHLADVRLFEATFPVAEDGPAVTAHLLNLLAAIPCAGKQVHDANIVATMLAHGIPNLLTHNVADFNRFAGRITILPLVP
jgi:predicted nucleic acid-binding protein